jgi:GxxExxY protein
MESTPGRVATPTDDLTYKIIGLAMAIHNELGPGFSEEIYQRAMVIGLLENDISHQTEYRINVAFRGKHVGAFELDFVVSDQVVVELKAVATLAPIHKQQAIAYLAASGLPVALLINFGAAKLEYQRLFPPRAVQSSAAYQARRPTTNSAPII